MEQLNEFNNIPGSYLGQHIGTWTCDESSSDDEDAVESTNTKYANINCESMNYPDYLVHPNKNYQNNLTNNSFSDSYPSHEIRYAPYLIPSHVQRFSSEFVQTTMSKSLNREIGEIHNNSLAAEWHKHLTREKISLLENEIAIEKQNLVDMFQKSSVREVPKVLINLYNEWSDDDSPNECNNGSWRSADLTVTAYTPDESEKVSFDRSLTTHTYSRERKKIDVEARVLQKSNITWTLMPNKKSDTSDFAELLERKVKKLDIIGMNVSPINSEQGVKLEFISEMKEDKGMYGLSCNHVTDGKCLVSNIETLPNIIKTNDSPDLQNYMCATDAIADHDCTGCNSHAKEPDLIQISSFTTTYIESDYDSDGSIDDHSEKVNTSLSGAKLLHQLLPYKP